MKVESLDCPNCGAPLPFQGAQTLAACVYCNSTIRITPASAGDPRSAPVAVRAGEVPPAVIDEVKRLLLLGQNLKAAEYYSREAHVPQEAAEKAVKGIEYNMAYYPPLTVAGVATLVGIETLSTAAILGGAVLIYREQWLFGVALVLLGGFLTLGITLVLMRGLRGFLLERRGLPATARVVKAWLIRTDQVRKMPVDLTRLLLEVQPEGRAPYQAEANCFIRQPSRPKFSVGSLIQVRYDPNDKQRVVVTGTGSR